MIESFQIPFTTILIVLIAFLFLGFLFFSLRHHIKVKKYLLNNLPTDEKTRSEAAKILGVESIAAIGVSIFDVLYNTVKFDPFVLKGIEHLHHAQHFENLGDLVRFMKDNIINSNEGTNAWRQMIHKYKGFTGEQIAADHLEKAGHQVDWTNSGTTPGFDFKVDGNPVNVKTVDTAKEISNHFHRHPNIDVIANKEMSTAYGHNPQVHIDHHLSSQEAFHTTSDTFSGIHDLGNFMHHIPLITLTISATRNTVGVIKGTKNITTAIEHTTLDTAGVGFGGFYGGKAGLAIGLALAPVTGGTSAIVIPAVTTLVGSIIGVFTGKSLTNFFKERHLRTAIENLKAKSESFQKIFIERFNYFIKNIDSFYVQKINRCNFARKEMLGWFKRLFFPSPLVKFYAMAISRLSGDWKQTKNYYNELKNKISIVEPNQGGLILYAQGPSILNGDEILISLYQEVDNAIKNVEKEKLKLK